MAKTSKVVRYEQRQKQVKKDIAAGRKPKYKIRVRNRCTRCGRPRGYIGFLGLCRQCAREFARSGEIAGMTKSSW